MGRRGYKRFGRACPAVFATPPGRMALAGMGVISGVGSFATSQPRMYRRAANTSAYRRDFPLSTGERERVSLTPVRVVAPSLPQPGPGVR